MCNHPTHAYCTPEMLPGSYTPIASAGAIMSVDWESRVNYDRLRAYRYKRVQDQLKKSALGSILLFDMNNIRYATAAHIGNWARDKFFRCTLITRDMEPILWDIGSAAKQHQLHNPWISPENYLPVVSSWRGSIPEEVGIEKANAKKIANILRDRGLANEPLGIDIVEVPVLKALEAEGLVIANAEGLMQAARTIKSVDEVALLETAATMVDAAYDDLYRHMRPGVKESELVAIVNSVLYNMGSENVEAVNAISGDRCSPHPHVFSDRYLRPGDMAYFDIIHSFMGYRTCYYRTLNVGGSTAKQRDVYKRTREILDEAISAIKPGATSADIAKHFPPAQEFGFASEEEAFGLQYAHGIGVGLWEQPLISRYHSFENPITIEEGMVFAIETYWPSADGTAAARIEEEIHVTASGPRLLTRFPAEHLLIAGTRYWNGHSFANGANELRINPTL
ncbi:MAG: aminopeptidase [Gammaproteobacteria bacterium]|jgi:Xaa-Pro dipeptidase|nr:aminopeptidase [Gammaproteobacteria bacterium]